MLARGAHLTPQSPSEAARFRRTRFMWNICLPCVPRRGELRGFAILAAWTSNADNLARFLFPTATGGGFARLEGDGPGALARLEREGRRRPALEDAVRAFDPDAVPAAERQAKLDRIKRELESVPALPGVYLWKDAQGQVIYVGKAKQLRARMRQYVNYQDERAKIPLLVDQIDSFDYIVVENEHESLVLEKNLINQHAPFFNADFKDDKSYPLHRAHERRRVPPPSSTRGRSTGPTRATSAPTPTAALPARWWTSPGAWCRCALRRAPIGGS